MTINRRQIMVVAAATVAAAALPVSAEKMRFPLPPHFDRQTFFDGRTDWTYYAARREWVGIWRDPVVQALNAAWANEEITCRQYHAAMHAYFRDKQSKSDIEVAENADHQ
jgi:hypothetical protein